MNIFEDQAEFMRKAEQPINMPTFETESLAIRLVMEENEEFDKCQMFVQDDYNALKEAIDAIYVYAQYLNTCIGPARATKLWNKIHENNMSKMANGLVKDAKGKILKPPEYKKITVEQVKEWCNEW